MKWVKRLSVVLIFASLVMLARLPPMDRVTVIVSSWTPQAGVWGPVCFGAIYVLAALLFVPGALLTVAAGGLFGLAWGTATVSLASTIAAAFAFLIGRHLARSTVATSAGRYPKFKALDQLAMVYHQTTKPRSTP